MVNVIACSYPDSIRSAVEGDVAEIERELLTGKDRTFDRSVPRPPRGAHGATPLYIGNRSVWVKYGVALPQQREQGMTDELVMHMVQHEAAAYTIAKIIGLAEHVPITVVREFPNKSEGTTPCAVIIDVPDNVERGAHDGVSAEQIRRCAAFDYAIAMDDRVKRNWMITTDGDGRPHLVLFDHGAAFGWVRFYPAEVRDAVWNSEKRGSWVRDVAAQSHGGPAYEMLAPLLDAANIEALRPYLEQWQIDELLQRIREVV